MNWINQLKNIINTGQSRSIIITGNINDLFFDGSDYVPILDYISSKTRIEADVENNKKGILQLIYELNNPIKYHESRKDQDYYNLNKVWREISKNDLNEFKNSNTNTTKTLENLRQISFANRNSSKSHNNLLIMIEAADMLIPENEISRMSLSDRHRVGIIHDWFSDPNFINSGDSVILLSESRGSLHSRISKLPQVLSVDVPLPDLKERIHFIDFFSKKIYNESWNHVDSSKLAQQTSGLSIYAIRQLILSDDISHENVACKVEEYMISQLGEGVVEFKRPKHKLDDCVGFSRIKSFMKEEVIPGFKDGNISGTAVCGPIGCGKTFICEAVAAEMDTPVIVLKSIRSKWFGETDRLFERLRRLLETFHKVVIFVDEADTQFGNIEGGHETEKRLTGKIQAMMSDTALKGKVIWFLMTARIHLLSPDIRRSKRLDVIIPILDPEDQDKEDFLEWTFKKLDYINLDENEKIKLKKITNKYSAAAFDALRVLIKTKMPDSLEKTIDLANDVVLPDIERDRKYQILQAKMNCTRKSLLFDEREDIENFESHRLRWSEEIDEIDRNKKIK